MQITVRAISIYFAKAVSAAIKHIAAAATRAFSM
jgi:hypothetical protein